MNKRTVTVLPFVNIYSSDFQYEPLTKIKRLLNLFLVLKVIKIKFLYIHAMNIKQDIEYFQHLYLFFNFKARFFNKRPSFLIKLHLLKIIILG